MTDSDLLLLWGKLGKETNAYPDLAHPVVCHLLDVQHVAMEIWNQSLGGGMRDWMAESLGMQVEDAGWWIASWVAAHDLGKISPDFQTKAAKNNSLLVPTLEAAGFIRHRFRMDKSRRSHCREFWPTNSGYHVRWLGRFRRRSAGITAAS